MHDPPASDNHELATTDRIIVHGAEVSPAQLRRAMSSVSCRTDVRWSACGLFRLSSYLRVTSPGRSHSLSRRHTDSPASATSRPLLIPRKDAHRWQLRPHRSPTPLTPRSKPCSRTPLPTRSTPPTTTSARRAESLSAASLFLLLGSFVTSSLLHTSRHQPLHPHR